RSRSSSGTWPASSDAASRSASTRRGSPSRSPTSPSTGETARPSPGPGTPAKPRPGEGARGTSHDSWRTAMAIRFYNTLTRSLDEFVPIEPGHVRMYACGPTVYQPPHIGNYRTFLFNDLVHRYLEWRGYRVRFVMNLTDVDDKTIAGAREQGISLEEFTAPVIRSFFRDLETLGVKPADAYPRATRHVGQMIELISRLLERGHAYTTDDGSVYFDITSFPEYGKLSRIDLSATRKGERVAADEYEKGDIRDFALWKAARDADREVG